uniref:Uncharacterized protein n=1 Tax=Aegilops tauschii subsp. strangulata TaxID=200361 RepID=A0A453FVM6_AEGTS
NLPAKHTHTHTVPARAKGTHKPFHFHVRRKKVRPSGRPEMFRHSSSAPSYGDAYMQEALTAVPTLIPRSAAGGYFDGGNVGGAFPP